MSVAQGLCLFGMASLSLLSLITLIGDVSKRTRFWVLVWAFFWGLPPMLVLWIKGVFG